MNILRRLSGELYAWRVAFHDESSNLLIAVALSRAVFYSKRNIRLIYIHPYGLNWSRYPVFKVWPLATQWAC